MGCRASTVNPVLKRQRLPHWRHGANLFLALVLPLATLMHGSSLVWLPAHAVALWTPPRTARTSFECRVLAPALIALALSIFTGLTPLWWRAWQGAP